MKVLLNKVIAELHTFFFSWGYFKFSAGSFCYQQNKVSFLA
ncbi:MAG: hypothetical protein U0L26_13025 [Cellulosilyticum sp.]|nr:hypothetical protein [Cellulosilyticum sp.]